MKIRASWFNIYLLGGVLLICGCHTKKAQEPKKHTMISCLRIHLEVNADSSGKSERVPVFREHPVMVNVESEPFLTEADVAEARVVDELGGFALRIKFERKGALLLEQYSGANRGKHMAIFGQFFTNTTAKLPESRWLAAPKIARRVSDGVLSFTPDATREESQQLVLGLNNVAREAGHMPYQTSE
jgi:hypothetical protein